MTGGRVRVPGWPQYTTQAGDLLRDLLDQMGAEVTLDRDGLTVQGTGELYGVDADLSDAGELTPTVAALAALADSPSQLRGVAHIRGHETDRLAALAAEIGALGGDVRETPDGLVVRPRALHGGVFRTYGDHRMATAGAVLGLRVPGVLVEDVETTAKTLARVHRTSGRRCSREPPVTPPRRRRDLDESDVRIRPNPRGSRPRTKERPRHEDSMPGWVVAVDRGRYTVLLGGPEDPGGQVTAMKTRELGRAGVVVGDRVALVGDISGGAGHARPDRAGRGAVEPAAAQRRRQPRRGSRRAADRRQRRSAGRGHRSGGPGAPATAGRSLPWSPPMTPGWTRCWC